MMAAKLGQMVDDGLSSSMVIDLAGIPAFRSLTDFHLCTHAVL